MTTPSISLTPRRAAVLAGFESTVDVLVRVTPPPRPAAVGSKRPPLHLALVIDRSGSMSGQPLAEAKKAAAFVVAGLQEHDRASLVCYDDHVSTLVPLTAASATDAFRSAIDGIDTGGNTNLHGGWFAGAETLAPSAGPETLSRVILLSDGCANHGLTEPSSIFRQCAELASTGVTTSTYGLGQGFNEDLMIGMARAGQGNHYYGETAADLMDPFREELALLNALCAKHVCLHITPATGVKMEILNQYTRTENGGIRLPDLAYGGEAWVVVRLTVKAHAAGSDIGRLLHAKVSFLNLDGNPDETPSVSMELPSLPPGAFEALPQDELVARRAIEIEVAHLQTSAREAARRRDWVTVDRLIAHARTMSADNPWLQAVISELERLARRRDDVMFSKEASYSASRMQMRLAPVRESINPGTEEELFLRRKFSQGKGLPD